MALTPGHSLDFDGATGSVVAVTATTDADGRGSISYGGSTFSFRALKATVSGVDYPLVATSDAVFRVGVVQQTADPTLFCLVLDDGPASSGWGRSVVGIGGAWAVASAYAAEDSVVFRMGWAPGTITIKAGGVLQASVYADLVLTYATRDGSHEAWWQPAYPSKAEATWGAPAGCFRTDANGILWDVTTGTEQPIIVPCGFGARGYRSAATDGWVGCPESERLLTNAELWYLGFHMEMSEGASLVFDTQATVNVTGPANAYVQFCWEDGVYRSAGLGTLNGSGEGTFTVALGRYSIRVSTSDRTKGLPRSPYLDVIDPGETYEVDFGSSWIEVGSPADPKVQGVLGFNGSTPAAGLTIYGTKNEAPPHPTPITWDELGTTAEDGSFGPIDTTDYVRLIVQDATYGLAEYAKEDPNPEVYGWWDSVIAASTGACRGAGPSGLIGAEGVLPWGNGGAHNNLQTLFQAAYLECNETGEPFWLHPTDSEFGQHTDPLRYQYYTPFPPQYTSDLVALTYDFYDADGTLLWGNKGPGHNAGPASPHGTMCIGQTVYGVVGGKIAGNLIEASRGNLVTVDNLREAARMGLETGRFAQPLEARADSETAAPSTKPTTWTAAECPYCGGPAWSEPDGGGYLRGYCIPCAANGYLVDCRPYFLTQTFSATGDWTTRCVRNTTSGAHTDKRITGWPRPAEYYETDGYLVDPWEDGLPRWVAVHLVLGSLVGGTFTDGESIADAEARVGDTIGPVQLKLLLTADYTGTGRGVRVTATNAYTGAADALTATVPAGARAGDLVFLKWSPHDAYPGARNWYTDVTDAEEVSGDGAVSCQIVNDGPSWRSSTGCLVTRHAHSPWACDVRLRGPRPWLDRDPIGRVWLVAERHGRILCWWSSHPDLGWSGPWAVTDDQGWSNPTIATRADGCPIVSATRADGRTVLFVTRNDGAHWTAVTGDG